MLSRLPFPWPRIDPPTFFILESPLQGGPNFAQSQTPMVSAGILAPPPASGICYYFSIQNHLHLLNKLFYELFKSPLRLLNRPFFSFWGHKPHSAGRHCALCVIVPTQNSQDLEKSTSSCDPSAGKSNEDPKKYRPMSLLCAPFKIFGRLIYARVEPIIDPLLPHEQAAFDMGGQP